MQSKEPIDVKHVENKYIFLDVDGVVNNRSVIDHIKETIGAPICTNVDFDWRNVILLNYFTQHPQVYIILSSTWRGLYDIEEIKEFFWITGLGRPERIIDVTPGSYQRLTSVPQHYKDTWTQIESTGPRPDTLNPNHIERGIEIEYWMESNKIPLATDNYLIIDDDSDFLTKHVNNFVKTDSAVGLTKDDVMQGLNILGLEEFYNK